MEKKQRFGGSWTIKKLDILEKYLNFYVNALKNKPFKKIYIDAFAGNGYIEVKDKGIIEGSAQIALKAQRKFDKYIFIERNKRCSEQLERLVSEQFANLRDRIEIINDDSNLIIQKICNDTDWNKSRAVIFLDPFAMQVKWNTLKCIAATKAMDLWYLFPMGAVNRLMKNDGNMKQSWKSRLDIVFGDNSWYTEFYRENPQTCMFEDMRRIQKNIDTALLKKYICEKLGTIFPKVADNPRIFYNRRNSPMFLFCFAVSNDNPKAIGLAMKGADYILKNS